MDIISNDLKLHLSLLQAKNKEDINIFASIYTNNFLISITCRRGMHLVVNRIIIDYYTSHYKINYFAARLLQYPYLTLVQY